MNEPKIRFFESIKPPGDAGIAAAYRNATPRRLPGDAGIAAARRNAAPDRLPGDAGIAAAAAHRHHPAASPRNTSDE